ncbi:sigma-70 family RNA polymerase sigma factor [Baekduia soli]|uniref:RNA polymerase sigma factor n=1 Tax=Baekduia soli TaxID=496014 RepID=A0A5B8UBR8_9ACTN|nr:sigma-70 family RNA polymerase sigma factor [Baekduia soli]QEC50258.1 sigma-70 family RNA polymerase sigma factor [Baekduia soli]
MPATARGRADAADHDLVRAVRAGDDRAFERLYQRYHRRISAYLYGMVRDHGRAEDLTQEVFVAALRRMRQTTQPIAFKPWIYEIAKNAGIDAFRRGRRSEEVSYDAQEALGAADLGRLASPAPGPDAAVDAKQRLSDLCGAFGGLSPTHHQILVMRELEGLSYREIGERLGLSRAAVESTLFRARRRLTEEYSELVTGERCLVVRAAVGRAGTTGAAALSGREERRVGSHLAQCTPCRREAQLAGLDVTALMRGRTRSRLAALLPLPAFLRRRLGGTDAPDGGHADAAGTGVAQHGTSLTQASLAAAQYGDSAGAGWVKAAAAVAALALTGVGAGAVVQHDTGAARAAAAQPTGGPGGAAGSSGAGARAAAAVAATSARTPAGRAGAGSGSATRPATAPGASQGSAGADPGTGAGAGGSAPSAASGAASTGSSARPAGHDSTPSVLTGALGGAGSSGGGTQPLVDPDPVALLQPPASAPATAGQVVSHVTDAAGATIGGTAGQVVEDTGQAVGQTVDQTVDAGQAAGQAAGAVAQGAAGQVGQTVAEVKGTVGTAGAQAVQGATGAVAGTAGKTVDGVTGTVSGLLGGS